jgi:hypothetical protein
VPGPTWAEHQAAESTPAASTPAVGRNLGKFIVVSWIDFNLWSERYACGEGLSNLVTVPLTAEDAKDAEGRICKLQFVICELKSKDKQNA